jgi:hypothetical protein
MDHRSSRSHQRYDRDDNGEYNQDHPIEPVECAKLFITQALNLIDALLEVEHQVLDVFLFQHGRFSCLAGASEGGFIVRLFHHSASTVAIVTEY